MWSLIFLFDRERGRKHRRFIGGLLVGVLVVVSHLWLSGPWMRQAGLSRDATPSVAAPNPLDVLRDTLTGLVSTALP
jgi:hypothetical protein